MTWLNENTRSGLLVSYGVNVFDLFRRAGFYVDEILRGANPADLPVEQPTKFELAINLRPPKRWASPFRRRSSPVPMEVIE
jgi:putative tryptophan/tyrosine transport system substrate-binding protein